MQVMISGKSSLTFDISFNISNIRRYVSLASLAAKQLGSIHENMFVPMFQREVTPTTSLLFRNHARSSRDKVALVTCHYDCHVIQATRHFFYFARYFHPFRRPLIECGAKTQSPK